MKIISTKVLLAILTFLSFNIHAYDGVFGCDGYTTDANQMHINGGPSSNNHYLAGDYKFKATTPWDLSNYSSTVKWELHASTINFKSVNIYEGQGPFSGHWNIDSKDNFTFNVDRRGYYCAVIKWNKENRCNNRCFTIQDKPTADNTHEPSQAVSNTPFQFYGDGEIDDNALNNTLSYNWNFGDGTTSTQENPIHYFSKAGTYNVHLTTNDGTFTSNIDSSVVWVRGPAEPPKFLIYEGGSCSSSTRNGVLEWERSGQSFQVQIKSGTSWNTIYNGTGTIKAYSTSSTGTKSVRIKASDPNYGPDSNWKTYRMYIPSCGGGEQPL
jgi:PKD repeat protein